MIPFRTRATTLILASLVLGIAALSPTYGDEAARKAEIKMGREAAVDVEKEAKLITDPKLQERLDRVGQAVAAVANSDVVPAKYGNSEIYKFDYKFKIVDDESVNAFSLPGGLIYVHKGLLDYVESDHELAGVLAHEIAHCAHHHMTYLIKEESKLDGEIALVLIAGMLAKVNSENLGHLLIGAQLVRIARSSGYGQKAEKDADIAGVMYTAKAGFNPVGSLTFLERLAHDYSCRPAVDLGIMQTHPPAPERCKYVLAEIKSLGLPINRRAVTNSLKAVTEVAKVGDRQACKVKLGDQVLFEAANIESTVSSEQRAEAVATRVNQLLDSEPTLRDVTLSADGRTVLARGEPIVVVTPQDCDLSGKPAPEVASQTAHVLKLAVWGEMIERMN
jgi:beta-barrel assembly-enhancing protease